MYGTVFWTLWEKARVGCFKRTASKHVSRVKQITSPGWKHETSARTWCTGKTQRGRVEREVGEGIGMGNTCKPMADSFQCMTKPTTIKKQKTKSKTKQKVESPFQEWRVFAFLPPSNFAQSVETGLPCPLRSMIPVHHWFPKPSAPGTGLVTEQPVS